MSALNENIRNFRELRRLTQKRFSEMLGKSRNVISNWERGTNSPDPDTIERICKILRVTPNQLFGWESCPDYVNYLDRLNKIIERESMLAAERDKIQEEIATLRKVRAEMTVGIDDAEIKPRFNTLIKN